MDIKTLTLAQAVDLADNRRAKLGQVFEEAKTDDGKYDFNKVKSLGSEFTGSISVAEKTNQMNAELNEICEHIDTLRGAEKAAEEHANRSKARGGLQFPGSGRGGRDADYGSIKSLGQRVSETKSFRDWAANGASGGVTFSFDDMWLSDMLAAGAVYDTMGQKALMTRAAGMAPEALRQPGFVEAVTRPIQLLDIIPTFQTGFDTIKYMEENTRGHAAAEKAEGAAYAESSFAFTERSSPVEKITDSVPVTDEQLEDVPMMEGYINGRLTFGIRQRLDGACLIGSGVAPQIKGLKNTVGIQAQAKGADPVPDTFFKAMTKIRLVGRAVPTHHVMHPTDWQNIRLIRTVDGVYIWGSPSEAGPERLWGLPVIQCDADAAGIGYTGSFMPSWIALFERRGVTIEVGYVGSQFAEGKRTVRGNARAAQVVFRPAAFCQSTGL